MEPAPFKMAAAQTNSTLAAGIRALRAHFDSVILPMWMGPGFNQALGLPFESLDAASGNPLPAERYRAMACARQLYVYVEASGPTRPRMPTACSSPCAPISRMRAAAGATAWTRRRVRWTRPGSLYPRLHRVRLRRVFPALAQRRGAQAHAGRGGNHRGPLQAARRSVRSGCRFGLEPRCAARQNPMMHLTEAYLAAAQVAEPALFAQRCARWRRASPSISCMRPRSACPRRRREPRTTGMSPAISLNGCPWCGAARSV